ncbi:MAG: HepT-like ribonuclease domain-containing protein, partial [Bacteroidota bacterium]
ALICVRILFKRWNMSLPPLEHLRHIMDETDYLISETKSLTYDQFIQDETLKRAFVRSIEIIGEAAKNVPPHIQQKYQSIEWRTIAGMRDKLIHYYFGVDYEIVWDVVINKIPQLRQDVEEILRKERTS